MTGNSTNSQFVFLLRKGGNYFSIIFNNIPWESRKFSNKKLPVGKIGKTPPLSPEKYGVVSF